jgi:anti-sigma-K factor RskA
VPGSLYAAAAVVVAVGLTLTLQQPGSTPAVAVMAPPEPVIEQVTFVAEALAETNEASVMTASTPAPEKPIIMLRVNADELIDTPRSGLTFGGDSSVPVSYER